MLKLPNFTPSLEGHYPGLEKSSDFISSLFTSFSRADHLLPPSSSDLPSVGKLLAAGTLLTSHFRISRTCYSHRTEQKQNSGYVCSAASSILAAAITLKGQPRATAQHRRQKAVVTHTCRAVRA